MEIIAFYSCASHESTLGREVIAPLILNLEVSDYSLVQVAFLTG
jgi:hypothetical protein